VACNNQVCFLLQVSSKTRAQDGAGTSRGGEETPSPPLIPPMLAEAIAALINATTDNTHFLREMTGHQIHQQRQRSTPRPQRHHMQRSTPRPQRHHIPGIFRNLSTSFC
jgi:hypothetical protein